MANAQYRYTGANARIDWAGTTISNDYTELSIELKVKLEDRTAGSETDASFNTTIKEGKASLKLFDIGENGVAIVQLFKPGVSGNLTVWTKGNTVGKPKLTFPCIVSSFKETVAFDKNLMWDVELTKNGAMVDDLGTLA